MYRSEIPTTIEGSMAKKAAPTKASVPVKKGTKAKAKKK